MNFLRKHRYVVAVYLGVAALAAVAWMSLTPTGLPVAWGLLQDSGFEPVTEVEKERVLGVLRDVGLDLEGMAALSPTAEQAEFLVGAARTWYFEQEQALIASRAALAVARSEWRSALKDLRTGSAGANGQAALELANGVLGEARTSLDGVLEALRTQVAGQLSESQVALWHVLTANTGRSMPFRLLALTDAQGEQLGDAKQQLRSDLASAANNEARAQALTTWNGTVGSTLTDANESMVDAYVGYVDRSTLDVVAAIETVLPIASGEES